MDSRYLGRSGLQVSRLALGTMTWGRDTDADAAAAQLEAFVEVGGSLIQLLLNVVILTAVGTVGLAVQHRFWRGVAQAERARVPG